MRDMLSHLLCLLHLRGDVLRLLYLSHHLCLLSLRGRVCGYLLRLLDSSLLRLRLLNGNLLRLRGHLLRLLNSYLLSLLSGNLLHLRRHLMSL